MLSDGHKPEGSCLGLALLRPVSAAWMGYVHGFLHVSDAGGVIKS